eukprot:998955_1
MTSSETHGLPPPPNQNLINLSTTSSYPHTQSNAPPPPPKKQNVQGTAEELKSSPSNPSKISQKRTLEQFETKTTDDHEPLLKKQKLNVGSVQVPPREHGVLSWNHYAVIFWLNRVNDGKLAYIEYVNLRKHIFIGKIKGDELHKINDVILRMIGIYDEKLLQRILNAIQELLRNDAFSNIVAETITTDDIPYEYCDPITYELMQDPVTLLTSGNTHERLVIEAYINRFNKDPVSQQNTSLTDIVPNDHLKQKIDEWKKANFNLP